MVSATAAGWSRPEPRARRGAAPPLARERVRRRLVALVLLLVLVSVLEGAVRKWVAPQLGAYVFFARDPLLLLAYGLAWRHGWWPRRSAWMALFAAYGALGVLWLVLQAATGGHSDLRLVLGVYGWRAYFLYPPLALLIGSVLRRDDVVRVGRAFLWLAVPVAVLVLLQFFSPPGAPINVGIAEERELQFHGLAITGERTRPMGPFASGAGQTQFAALVFMFVLAFVVSPRRLAQPGLATLALGIGAAGTCVALGGSRGLVVLCGLLVAAAVAVAVVGRGGAVKARALLWPLLITAVALAAYPVVFPEGYEAFSARWAHAQAVEGQTYQSLGVIGRALWGILDFLRVIDEVPLLGSGLGFGGNAAWTLGARIDGQPPPYGENEFARHMIDLGPLFGLAYIGLRLALLVWLARRALATTRRSGDPLPMLLLAYVAVQLVSGQVTGQGTINFYCWLVAGLLIAVTHAPPARARRIPTRNGAPS